MARTEQVDSDAAFARALQREEESGGAGSLRAGLAPRARWSRATAHVRRSVEDRDRERNERALALALALSKEQSQATTAHTAAARPVAHPRRQTSGVTAFPQLAGALRARAGEKPESLRHWLKGVLSSRPDYLRSATIACRESGIASVEQLQARAGPEGERLEGAPRASSHVWLHRASLDWLQWVSV